VAPEVLLTTLAYAAVDIVSPVLPVHASILAIDLSHPMTEKGNPHPHIDAARILHAAGCRLRGEGDGRRIVAEDAHLNGLLEELEMEELATHNQGNFIVEHLLVFLAESSPSADAVDESLFEKCLRADAKAKVAPIGWVSLDRLMELLAPAQEGVVHQVCDGIHTATVLDDLDEGKTLDRCLSEGFLFQSDGLVVECFKEGFILDEELWRELSILIVEWGTYGSGTAS
jgi:hypothetical protein